VKIVLVKYSFVLAALAGGLFVGDGLRAQNDPLSQWHHTNIDSASGWARLTDCNKVVGIFDTGVRYDHQDLNDNMLPGSGYDYTFDRTGSSVTTDVQGHGTFVAGFIGAEGNNGIGVTGLCWGADMTAMQVLSNSGSGNFSWAATAIYASASRGIQVANHSYGADLRSNPFGGQLWPSVMITALEASGSAGIINVFAAGNNTVNLDGFISSGGTSIQRVCSRTSRGRCTSWKNQRVTLPDVPPAMPTGTLVVASSQSDRALSSFSNLGGRVVHLSAPGSNVVSTSNASTSSYSTMSGTSFASPIVAGAVTLLWSRNPSWSASQVIQELLTQHAAQPVVSWTQNEWTIVGYSSEIESYCMRFGSVNRRTRVRPCLRWGSRTVETPQYGYADVSYSSTPQAGTTLYGELRLTGMR
jgi:subtilisin family serine protease